MARERAARLADAVPDWRASSQAERGMRTCTARREQEREVQAAEERRRAEQRRLFEGEGPGGREEPRLRDSFLPLADGEPIHQKNEGEALPSVGGATEDQQAVWTHWRGLRLRVLQQPYHSWRPCAPNPVAPCLITHLRMPTHPPILLANSLQPQASGSSRYARARTGAVWCWMWMWGAT